MDRDWKCNVEKCGKESYHRTVEKGKEVFRCDYHLDKYYGYGPKKKGEGNVRD